MPAPKLFYLWTRRTLQKFYVFDGKEDLEKKKEIPECSSIVKRLKEATDKANQHKERAFKKWRKRL